MRPLLLACALLAGVFVSSAASPSLSQAFCRTLWLFGMPCADVATKLVQQIQVFNPVNACEKCHYGLIVATNESIQAHHASANNLQFERIEFGLQTTILTHSCRVSAESSSLTSTSIFDGGLNYCNLHDLLTASGLNMAPSFTETTSEWACLGFGVATCKA